MRHHKFLVAAVLVALVAVSATQVLAQGRRGGQGGPGGPGGPGGRGMGNMILTIPEVQTELGLSEQQKNDLKAISDDARKQFQQIDWQAMRDLSQEEREKKFTELRKKGEDFAKQSEEKIGKILDAKQTTRLNQLKLQMQGARALADADVIKKLKLTDDQQAKIKKITDDARGSTRGGFNPDASDEERKVAASKMRERRAKTLKDVLAVLDDEQLATWGEMLGKDFKFPENSFQFGRNRGGRGGKTTPKPSEN